MQVVSTAALAAAVFAIGAGGTPPAGTFSATITPAAVKPAAAVSFALVVKNLGDATASEVTVSVPTGFAVTGTPTASATAPCATGTWSVTVTDGVLDAKPVDSDGLCADSDGNAFLTIAFQASTPAGEGTYTWQTSVRHGSTELSRKGPQPSTVVDGTPPAVSISCNGAACDAWFTSVPVSVALAASDSGSSVAEIKYTTNGADPAASDGTVYKAPFTVAATTTIRYVAFDNAGNATAGSQLVRVDTEPPPKPTIESAPPAVSATSAADFSYSVEEPTAALLCSLDGGPATPCGTGSGTVSYHGLANGSHTFAVRARDEAGNVGEDATVTWSVATLVPPPVIASRPAALTTSTTATFGFTDDVVGAAFICSLDGSPFVACSSPATYSGIRDGKHTFSVAATHGVESPATSYSWTVDTIPPQTAITAGPPSATRDGVASFAFSSDTANARFQCSIDTTAFAPCAAPKAYGGLAPGAHAFRVRAIDPAGNVDPTPATQQWLIDVVPPAAPSAVNAAVGYGRLTLTWERPPDADFDHVTVFRSASADGRGAVAVYEGAATAYRDPGFANARYFRYDVIAYDRLGNASSGTTRTVLPSALLLAPRAGASVHRPPLLRWRAVARAAYYNVQLYRNGRKVLTAWPRRPRLQLGSRWSYAGKRERLARGRYEWWVWPALRSQSGSRYGSPIGVSGFRVR